MDNYLSKPLTRAALERVLSTVSRD